MKIHILLKQPYNKSLASDRSLAAYIISLEDRKDLKNHSQWRRVRAGQHSPQVSQGHSSIDFASGFPGSTGIPVHLISSSQTKLTAWIGVVKKLEDICGCYLFLLYSLFRWSHSWLYWHLTMNEVNLVSYGFPQFKSNEQANCACSTGGQH